MTAPLPQATRTYQNHHLDSTRWHSYTPRPDDIIVATPYKSGTTWMQFILLNLIYPEPAKPTLYAVSPWLDFRPPPLEGVLRILDQAPRRRFIKTHLPLDGLPYYPKVKYIVVSRDPRDVFMSLWNHYKNYSPAAYEEINNTPGRIGPPCPSCPTDIHSFWQQWITKGWFAWEGEGYPFWSNLRHIQTWWNFKHLPNIHLVHFNDLLSDLEGQIRRLAHYLKIELSATHLATTIKAVRFATLKKNAEKLLPNARRDFKGGATTFINKGTNGRWRPILTPAELQLYQAAIHRELSPECAHWLETPTP